MATNNIVVRVRINEEIKAEATAVLANIGLTVSDALRIMLTQVARDKKLPFERFIPDETTIEAMREARCGNLTGFNDAKGILNDLDD